MAYHNLFISHAWKYGDEYDRLVNLLNNATYFSWLNWSAPEDKPLIPEWMTVPNDTVLVAIAEKIRMADCVLVISGMYANYSDWIIAEMDIARHFNMPLIGIEPWGSQKIPTVVTDRTIEDVGWQTSSIVHAVRRHCRAR